MQADNLIAVLETLPPETRLIIHAGHGHAAEEPFIVDENFSINWFIAPVKERTGMNPLTVNLSNCGRAESVEYTFATPAFDELASGFDPFVSMPRAEQRSLSLKAMKTLGLKLQELAEADVPTERSWIVVRDRACRACQPYDILLWEPDRGNKAVVFVPFRGRYQVDIVELME